MRRKLLPGRSKPGELQSSASAQASPKSWAAFEPTVGVGVGVGVGAGGQRRVLRWLAGHAQPAGDITQFLAAGGRPRACPAASDSAATALARVTTRNGSFEVAACRVTRARPRGCFGLPRRRVGLGGQRPPPDTAGAVTGAVTGALTGERIVGHAWPLANNEVVLREPGD